MDQVGFYDNAAQVRGDLETYLNVAHRKFRSSLMEGPLWIGKSCTWTTRRKELRYSGRILYAEHHESHVADAWMRLPVGISLVTTPMFQGILSLLVLTPIGLLLCFGRARSARADRDRRQLLSGPTRELPPEQPGAAVLTIRGSSGIEGAYPFALWTRLPLVPGCGKHRRLYQRPATNPAAPDRKCSSAPSSHR